MTTCQRLANHVLSGLLALALAAASGACGGAPAARPSAPVGTTHVETPPVAATALLPDAAPTATAPGTPGQAGAAAGPEVAPAETAPVAATQPASAPVTGFEIKNEGKHELAFAIDKGWQPVVFGFSGKPPKAKAALFFPTYCTASCDEAAADRCPVCARESDPAKIKQAEAAETKREVAAPGASVKVPWDGKLYVYEKVAGKKRCKCWRKVDPEPGTYTVKACGLVKAGEASASKLICGETTVELPLAAPGLITVPIGK